MYIHYKTVIYTLPQRAAIGGPRVLSDPKPLVTSLAKLFVNLLPVATNSFIFSTSKDLEKVVTLISSKYDKLLTLKPYRKM
jgi:hypothetical protein